MGCNCGKSKTADVSKFVVTLANGTTKEVDGELAARVEISRAGGGTYRRK